MAETPMMEQYREIKKEYPDTILFFRLGDFYEMFFADAELASQELGLTLTSREAGKGRRVPMCGVPYHASDGYIARLLQKGHNVAICEQVEDPRLAKGLVERQVVRVVTPGTLLDSDVLEEKRNNYLVALARDEERWGLAVLDAGTGELKVTELALAEEEQLLEELVRLQPAEGLLAPVLAADEAFRARLEEVVKFPCGKLGPHSWEKAEAEAALAKVWGDDYAKRFNCQGLGPARVAAGAALNYLASTQKTLPAHVTELVPYTISAYMQLDAYTRRNLELVRTLREGKVQGSLLGVLDLTVTAMGGRLLRQWLEQPLRSPRAINRRLSAVAELRGRDTLRQELRRLLRQIPDLERLLGKVVYGTATPKDLASLRTGLGVLPNVIACLAGLTAAKRLCADLAPLADLRERLAAALVDDPPATAREGKLVRPGYDAEIDRLRELAQGGRQWIAALEARERERTGIKSLRVGYNKVFGYYIEVTRANLDNVPPDYIRRQTLVGAERFVTPDLKEQEASILGAQERLAELEYAVFRRLCQEVVAEAAAVRRTAQALARLDVLATFAEAAARYNYARPEVNAGDVIRLVESRHPVVERLRPEVPFVPNDVYLDGGENRFILLTGPNMAGKSTCIRQVALNVLLAQVGSFVPARQAEIGVVDRIFTRVGAADDLAAGDSTFMVEMRECEVILREATPKSLVILDEVGRGTSTLDGLSLAQAIAEHLAAQVGCKTLFSTHYHELTALAGRVSGIKNFSMAVAEKGQDLLFLRRVVPGGSDRSYGIQVARLAGLPQAVLRRAAEVLASLSGQEAAAREAAATWDTAASVWERVGRRLLALDLAKTPPLELALQVAELQEELRRGGAASGKD
ncbi:DNA mismatch repair protein MutS [Gelria sp. Kuro-4]|nr:DNA mismatch repair protein MutS [Gelria sp. Kuro-4]